MRNILIALLFLASPLMADDMTVTVGGGQFATKSTAETDSGSYIVEADVSANTSLNYKGKVKPYLGVSLGLNHIREGVRQGSFRADSEVNVAEMGGKIGLETHASNVGNARMRFFAALDRSVWAETKIGSRVNGVKSDDLEKINTFKRSLNFQAVFDTLVIGAETGVMRFDTDAAGVDRDFWMIKAGISLK